jgi:predicted O-methyltransferase YrrM
MNTSDLLLVILSVVCLYSLHKLRKVHLLLYKTSDQLDDVKKEVFALFGQLQAQAALERSLALGHPLPPLRGWAGSPDFLLHVHQHIKSSKPKVIVECSSGSSTVVCARTLQQLGDGHVYSLEHSPEYAKKTRVLLEEYGLSDWATVIDAPLTFDSTDTPWYSLQQLPAEVQTIDLLVVDGPPADTAPLARRPALRRLLPMFATRFTILLDDANRQDEQEIVRDWQSQFRSASVNWLPAEKGCVLLEIDRSNETAH